VSRLARASVAAGGAVLALAAGAGPVDAQGGGDGARVREVGSRVRALEGRLRTLEYRWRALDDSERVEQGADETTITFAADVLFAYDQADLSPEARQRLDQVVAELDELGPRTVTIAGHTDDHGEPAYNQSLSERRAEAVRAALDAELGDGFGFDVAGHGETQPVAPNQHDDGSDNPEGRALNRRVEITFPTG
jgi:outer membrane protein OmpA-like peptidoglycan-associated protein